MYETGVKHKLLPALMLGVAAIGFTTTFSTISKAQNTIELPGITVEASSLDGEAIDVENVGSSVTVITGKQIEQQQARHVGEVLRNLAGVNVGQTGSASGLTQVRLRGAESNHTLVVIDGIVVNTATEGAFDFSNLSASDIEQIEVLKGPQSGIYGSNALGGVIKITTKKGRGPLRATIQAEGGSFNTKAGKVNISGGNEKVFGSLTVDHFKTDGFDLSKDNGDKEDGQRRSVFFNGGVRPLENLTINFTLRDVKKSGGADEDLYVWPAGSDGELENTAASFTTNMFLIGTSAKLDTLGGKWTHTFNANQQKTDIEAYYTDFGGNLALSNNEGETNTFSYLSTLKFATPGILNASHTLTGLAEYKEESYVQVSETSQKRTRTSYALQYRGVFDRGLSVAAAIRHDDNDKFKDFTTYNVNAAWKIPRTGFRVHSNVGTGVVAPGMFEQFGSFFGFVNNPDLLPEESFGWDVGVEWQSPGKAFKIDVTYFNQDLENEIGYNSLFGPGIPTLINLDGQSKRQGVELQITSRITNNLYLSGAYTYLDAVDGNGNEEIRRAPHSAKLNVNYRFANNKGRLNLGVNYNGEAKDLKFVSPVTQTVTLDDYVLVSLAGSYQVQPNIELFGRVENLLDADYEEVYGFNTAGVTAYAGVKIKLGPVDEK